MEAVWLLEELDRPPVLMISDSKVYTLVVDHICKAS